MMKKSGFVLKAAAAIVAGTLVLSGCTTTSDQPASAATNASKRQAIDASVDATLSNLYSTVKGSRELVSKAQGVLVFPRVIQAGLIVGGEYGSGALRVGGSTEGFYSTTSASVGLQAGGQSKAVIILFMTRDSLDKFRNSDGWSAGADASVALVKVGANGTIDTTTATAPVEAFVLTNAGLMANVSIDGTKVSRLKI
jgi:lipid-binding SYLF domain-containing protein